MNLTVAGGGGMRTPLLIAGLIERHARLRIERVALYDLDAGALEVTAVLADALLARSGRPFTVTTTSDPDEAIAGASFVITSIRVGGLPGRVADEQVPLRHGVVGQETTGPGGWAMALRTIPVLVDLAYRIRRIAPDAWIINFTNPAGLITQALAASGERRLVGICDSPPALGRRIAAHLGVAERTLRLDYMGLNHLGWVRAIRSNGADRLPEILASDDAIRAIYGRPLFEPAAVRRLGLLPNEYLHYYYSHDEVVKRLRAAPQSRGEQVAEVVARLRTAVLAARWRGEDPIAVYQDAIFARRASYMATETGERRDLALMGGHVEGGYARAALDVIESMTTGRGPELILNTLNAGAIDDLEPGDVVEVPCRVDGEGINPRRMGALPAPVRGLVLKVKAYERATVSAALHASWREAVAALAMHPLVPLKSTAVTIAEELRRRLAPHLEYLHGGV